MIAVAICFVLMAALQFATPYWWWIMIVPFGYGLWLSRSAWQSARVGMCSAGTLWLGVSAYHYSTGAEVLASRMSATLALPHGALLILLTTLLAIVAAGISGWSGYSLKVMLTRK